MTWRERRTLSKDLQDEIDKEIVAAQQLLEDRKRKINDMLDSLKDEQGEPLYTRGRKGGPGRSGVERAFRRHGGIDYAPDRSGHAAGGDCRQWRHGHGGAARGAGSPA